MVQLIKARSYIHVADTRLRTMCGIHVVPFKKQMPFLDKDRHKVTCPDCLASISSFLNDETAEKQTPSSI
ncbi:MAG: hypothetical protein GY754_11015 [bacterium]|nr:hypothetical protein [bacterium]